jgi:phosphinothricin acetyltransferase
MTTADWPEVRGIYEAGIATGKATFDAEAPSWEVWDAAHRPDLRLVAVEEETVVGWVAAGPVSERDCYRGVVEHSVYVHPAHWGRGVGRRLLGAFIELSERRGVWSIRAGMYPENTASLALHAALGFRVVGTFERIGEQDGKWWDVLLLERRSRVVGTDQGAS